MDRHYIQLQILTQLLSLEEAKFSELNSEGYPSDQFNFHLQKLYKENLLTKTQNGYRLSTSGMELAGRLNFNNAMQIKQPKLGISIGIFRNNDSEVLVLKRTRNQSINKYAWFDRKWRFGSTIKDEIDSLLEIETGLHSNKHIFCGVTHVLRRNGNLVEIDTVHLNFKIQGPRGNIIEESKDGIASWFKIEEIKAVTTDMKVAGFNQRLESFLKEEILFQEFIL